MIGKTVKVLVDRPLGSYHPKHRDMYYPVNYGYIEGIMAPDGEEQDAYILGVDEPVKEKKPEREVIKEETTYKNERELFKTEKSSFNFTQFDDEELPPRRNVMDYESRTSSYKKEGQE